MSTAAPATVERWWRIVAEHPRRWCPHCGQRLCWAQADARGQLIATGEWHNGPPPDIARPHQAAGAQQMETPA